MCGIAGSLNWQKPDNESLIRQMTRALAHRGPDAENVISLGPLVLGHRRLSIIDTSALSNQPMTDHSGRFWIVFNGEIYNYQDLRSELRCLGHSFKTESDTEVILEAWKRWGLGCLERLVGMFAFALWDKVEESLWIVRDRLGEKPLYYTLLSEYANTGIVFASELKALQLHPAISKQVNPKAVSQFLSLNYVLTDTCILKGVEKLPPAHFLHLQRERSPSLKKYWDLSTHFKQKPFYASEGEASEKLNALLQQSVKQQTISDVPLGAFLSGGIDSSSIVSAMTKLGSPALTETFSIGFAEKTYSELAESQKIADFLGVNHHTQMVSGNITPLLPKIIQTMDEPFADSSMIPTYFLAEFARKNVKVCLSGDGGDELFAGYETYVADKLYNFLKFLPKPLIQALGFSLNKLLPVTHHKVSLDYKLKQFLTGCTFDFRRAHYFWRTIFSDSEKVALLRPELTSSVMAHDPYHNFDKFYDEVSECHYLDQASYVDIKTWLVDDILVKVDRTTMAHSLEARAPFLDHRLVEFAAELPVSWKMKGFEKKHILKMSQHKALPHETLYRAKKGFNAPISHWFTGPLQALGRDVTLSGALNEWFDKMAIEKLWQSHLTHQKDEGLKLFGLTCLGLWLQNLHSAIREDNYDFRYHTSVQ